MKNPTKGLLALLLIMPLASWSQDDTTMSDEERAVLEQELEQAREEVARAAREIARIQRQLVDEEKATHWIEREIETVEGKEVDRIYLSHRDRLVRPRLGVLLDSREGRGDVVVGLTPGSGADSAGILPGDRLIAINGEAVDADDPESFGEPLDDVDPGDSVLVEIERKGDSQTLEVEVSSSMPGKRRVFERRIQRDGDNNTELMIIGPEYSDGNTRTLRPPQAPRPPRSPRLAGLGRHSDLISNHAGLERYFGTGEGVVVLRIDAENPLQLEDGDVVLTIDGEAVSRPVEVGTALMGRGGGTVTLEIMRGGERTTLEARLP